MFQSRTRLVRHFLNRNRFFKSHRSLSGCSECANQLSTSLKKANQNEFGDKQSKSAFASQTDPKHQQEYAFDVAASSFKFGKGVLRELGGDARQLNMTRVAIISDKLVVQQPWFRRAVETLKNTSGIQDVVIFDEIIVEPTTESFVATAKFLMNSKVDGIISIGGGSVMDTAKAANLMAVNNTTDVLKYTNPPIGQGTKSDFPLLPHICCPSTSGTGSEQTALAIYDNAEVGAKTGMALRELKPDRAVIDVETVYTLPPAVVAASGFDVLSHSIESYTARHFTERLAPTDEYFSRPAVQGANVFSDAGCVSALELVGKYYKRAYEGAGGKDTEALDQMMFASTLAGAAMGNAGCTLPHAFSYPISSQNKWWQPPAGSGYTDGKKCVPHGYAVGMTAPAVFRFTASSNAERHLRCARLLDPNNALNTRDATPDQAGEALYEATVSLMKAVDFPTGLTELGFADDDVESLVEGAWPQRRLIDNCAVKVSKQDIASLFKQSFKHF